VGGDGRGSSRDGAQSRGQVGEGEEVERHAGVLALVHNEVARAQDVGLQTARPFLGLLGCGLSRVGLGRLG
jgi:hypothetical protein